MTKIDITPDKSLFPKLWSSGYSIPQALAELIDNSIDARVEIGMEIAINLFSDKITIADRWVGMDFNEIKNAIILAKSDKVGKLGEFGLGMKTACLSLGTAFKIISKKLWEDKEYRIVFDTEKWLKNDAWEIEVEERLIDTQKHYTVVEITGLRSKSIVSADKKLKEDIQMRFGHFLDSITINVNGDRVLKKKIEMSEWTEQDIFIKTPYWDITGWVWLMRDSSQKGYYGLHTYRNNRLIMPFNKVWFSAHPTVARVFWEIYLDFVPVTHNKKSFEIESEEYKLAEHLLEIELKDVVFEARKKKWEELQTKQVKEQTEVWEEKTSEAMKEVVKNLPESSINRSLPEVSIAPKQHTTVFQNQETPSNINPVAFEKIKSEHKQKILHIDFAGQNLSFVHLFESLGSENWPKTWDYDSAKKLITIITNTDFSTYYACGDLPFLALINISESLTEFLISGKENEDSVSFYKKIFNSIIRVASDLKEEL